MGARLRPVERISFARQVTQGVSFNEALRQHQIVLDLDALTPAGRWQTPPYVQRPFMAHFYLATVEAPELVQVPPNQRELEDGGWITAEAAMAAWRRGEHLLAPSTQWLLQSICDGALSDPSRFEAVEEARGLPPRWAEIRPGVVVYPVPTPTLPPATHTNVYVAGHTRLWIFDPASPWAEGRAALDAYLDGRIAAGAQVEGVVLTHHHHDHVGGARHLADRLGVPIYAHPATAALVDFEVERSLEEGDTLPCDSGDWRVLHTPGHAPGHLCFLDEATRSLVAGDMVAGIGTILVDPREGSMSAYLQSLDRLRRLAPSCLMPSHGAIIGGVESKLTGYIEHRKMRETLVTRALASEAVALDALLPKVYGDVAPAVWPVAQLSLLAHLIKLREEGRAICLEAGCLEGETEGAETEAVRPEALYSPEARWGLPTSGGAQV